MIKNIIFDIGGVLLDYNLKTYLDKLTDFMQKKYSTLKGFNRRGLYRMKQFYDTYIRF